MLKFRCKNCDQKIGVPDDWRGHVVRCPRCKQGVDVPTNAELVNKPLPPARAPAPSTPASTPAPIPAPLPDTPAPSVEAPLSPAAITVAKAQAPLPEPPIEAPAPAAIPIATSAPVVVAPPLVAPMPEPPAVGSVTHDDVPLKSDPPALMPVTPPIESPAIQPIAASKPAPAKPVKKPPKKSKVEPQPVEPALSTAHQVAEPAIVAAPAPPPTEILPEAPAPPAPDASVVMVTVARREEVEPAPMSDPATGNVVNLAEALTQSVVTPKPIVTSAQTSAFASVFSSGAAPETIAPIIDVEQAPPQPPVAPAAPEPELEPPEPEPIITSVAMDTAALFAGFEPQREIVVEPMGSDRALSEIVDVLPSEDQSSERSSAATDLLDTLARSSEASNPLDAPADDYVDSDFSVARPLEQTRRTPRRKGSGAGAVAVLAMLIAAASLGMCTTHSQARLSVPAGVTGLLLAVLATVLAQGRSGIAIITGIGAAVTSLTGIAIGVLIGLGILPGSAAYTQLQLARHLPAARAGDVEVRIRSASVMHPVLLMAAKRSGRTAQTATQSVLRVEVELKNVSDHANAQYTSWASTSARAEPVWLHDDEGNSLKPLSAAGAVPPGRAIETVTIKPRGGIIGDVLLFEAPPMHARELDLQLPGNNVGSLEPLQLHIPAEMFARQ